MTKRAIKKATKKKAAPKKAAPKKRATKKATKKKVVAKKKAGVARPGPTVPEVAPEQQVKNRRRHIEWLRSQTWYGEHTPEREAKQEAWVNAPMQA